METSSVAITTPDSKVGLKATKKAQRGAFADLRSSQKGEVWAMQQMGADRADIRAERLANQTELQGLKSNLRTNLTPQNYQTFQMPSLMTAQNYKGPLADKVNALLSQAAQTRAQNNMAPVFNVDSRTQTGFGLNHLVKPLYWQQNNMADTKADNPFMQLLNRTNVQYGNDALTAEQIARNGKLKSIKGVKGQEGLYRVNRNYGSGDDIHRISDYFTMNPDGTYKSTSYDRYRYDAPSKKSNLGAIIGGLGLAAFGVPMLGINGLATGSLAGTTVGGIAANTVGSVAASAASAGVR